MKHMQQERDRFINVSSLSDIVAHSRYAAQLNSCGGEMAGGQLPASALRNRPTSLAPWRLLQVSAQMFHA